MWEAKLIYQKYDEMMELLRSYRERIYQQWVVGVDRLPLQPGAAPDPATLSPISSVTTSAKRWVPSASSRGKPCSSEAHPPPDSTYLWG